MECPSCHSPNAEDARFCSECGNVTVTNAGRISTGAAGASERELADMYGGQGIFAQSVGGGGGNGGDALSFAPIFALGIGGDAGGGGDGGTVTVTSIGASHTPDGEFDISTGGSYSHGIHAQSVGGGGGTGGGAIAIAASVPKVPINLAVAIGGAGGDGGDGEQVTVINQSTIGTAGAKAYGVLAQSIGGGGGDGGYSVAAGIATTQQVGNVAVAVGGSGAVGAVQTEGQKSHGIAAQSIGGGGGNGGFAVAGTASFNNAAPVDLSVAVGGSGGRGGDGGLVTVVNAGDIETKSTPLPEAGVVGPYACGPDSGTCEAEDPVRRWRLDRHTSAEHWRRWRRRRLQLRRIVRAKQTQRHVGECGDRGRRRWRRRWDLRSTRR